MQTLCISLIAECPTPQYQLQMLRTPTTQRGILELELSNNIMMPIIIKLLFRLIFVQSRGHFFFNLQPIRLLAQTTLRNILGTKNLHEILSERDSISNSMQVMCLSIVCVCNQRIFALFRLLLLENRMHVK